MSSLGTPDLPQSGVPSLLEVSMKKVISGFNGRDDGFLIITDKELEDVAASMGMVSMQIEGVEMFLDPEIGRDSESILQAVADGETPRNTFRIYVSKYAEDVNLDKVVCW